MSTKKPTGKGSVNKRVDWRALEIVHPDAGGIDVGGSEHWVAISPDRDPEPVRRFGCFAADLREISRWLIEKGDAGLFYPDNGGIGVVDPAIRDSLIMPGQPRDLG